jgi:PBP1b-binding outer membrane lipoprotein LpoB
MNKFALALFAILLLGGCTESAKQTEKVNRKSPSANSPTAPDTSVTRTGADGSGPDAADAASPIDAARLLAATIETAKAENKRVMVHLGAPG